MITHTHEVVFDALSKRPLTAFQVQKVLRHVKNTFYSESTVTARIRDWRKPEFGGIDIRKESVPWSKAPVYYIEKYKPTLQKPAKKLTFDDIEQLMRTKAAA